MIKIVQYASYANSEPDVIEEKLAQAQLEDEVPDTTMLDSVILPAIASVSLTDFLIYLCR